MRLTKWAFFLACIFITGAYKKDVGIRITGHLYRRRRGGRRMSVRKEGRYGKVCLDEVDSRIARVHFDRV